MNDQLKIEGSYVQIPQSETTTQASATLRGCRRFLSTKFIFPNATTDHQNATGESDSDILLLMGSLGLPYVNEERSEFAQLFPFHRIGQDVDKKPPSAFMHMGGYVGTVSNLHERGNTHRNFLQVDLDKVPINELLRLHQLGQPVYPFLYQETPPKYTQIIPLNERVRDIEIPIQKPFDLWENQQFLQTAFINAIAQCALHILRGKNVHFTPPQNVTRFERVLLAQAIQHLIAPVSGVPLSFATENISTNKFHLLISENPNHVIVSRNKYITVAPNTDQSRDPKVESVVKAIKDISSLPLAKRYLQWRDEAPKLFSLPSQIKDLPK